MLAYTIRVPRESDLPAARDSLRRVRARYPRRRDRSGIPETVRQPPAVTPARAHGGTARPQLSGTSQRLSGSRLRRTFATGRRLAVDRRWHRNLRRPYPIAETAHPGNPPLAAL